MSTATAVHNHTAPKERIINQINKGAAQAATISESRGEGKTPDLKGSTDGD